MSISDPPANVDGRKGPQAVARVAGGAHTEGTRSGPELDARQQALATRRADCDTLLGAVVDRLRHAFVTPPDVAQTAGERSAAIRATVLQCADDLARVRDLLA